MTDLVIILRIKGGRSHRWSFTGCSSRRQAQLQSISLINGLMNRARSCDLTVLQPENTNTQPQGRRGRNQRGRDVQLSYTMHPSNTLFCILHLQRAPSRLVLIIIMNVWSLEVVRYRISYVKEYIASTQQKTAAVLLQTFTSIRDFLSLLHLFSLRLILCLAYIVHVLLGDMFASHNHTTRLKLSHNNGSSTCRPSRDSQGCQIIPGSSKWAI